MTKRTEQKAARDKHSADIGELLRAIDSKSEMIGNLREDNERKRKEIEGEGLERVERKEEQLNEVLRKMEGVMTNNKNMYSRLVDTLARLESAGKQMTVLQKENDQFRATIEQYSKLTGSLDAPLTPRPNLAKVHHNLIVDHPGDELGGNEHNGDAGAPNVDR